MGIKWAKKNPERKLAASRKWKANNQRLLHRYYKEYYIKNKDEISIKAKNIDGLPKRVKKVGITVDDYNKMFTEQKGKCAICGKHQLELTKSLHIDHCHRSGKIRGLLCSNCNTAIGLLQDDIENLRCAILYLNKRN